MSASYCDTADLSSDIHVLDDKAISNRIYMHGNLLRTVNVKFSDELLYVQALIKGLYLHSRHILCNVKKNMPKLAALKLILLSLLFSSFSNFAFGLFMKNIR